MSHIGRHCFHRCATDHSRNSDHGDGNCRSDLEAHRKAQAAVGSTRQKAEAVKANRRAPRRLRGRDN